MGVGGAEDYQRKKTFFPGIPEKHTFFSKITKLCTILYKSPVRNKLSFHKISEANIFFPIHLPPPPPINIKWPLLYQDCITISSHAWFFWKHSACGGSFIGDTGSVTSPGYPEMYPSNMDCGYSIRSITRGQIQVVFDEFHLPEPDLSCTSADTSLQVIDKVFALDTLYITRMCR